MLTFALLGRGGDVREGSQGVQLTDEQQIDWLRLIRSPNVGPRGIMAMAAELKGRVVGGQGQVAEVDSGYFGGYLRPANLREHRVDRRFAIEPLVAFALL